MTGISKYNFMPRKVAMQNSKIASSSSGASGASGTSGSGSIQPIPLPSGGSTSGSSDRLSEFLDKMSDYAKNDVTETKTEKVTTRSSENIEPQKPTLDNMDVLYEIFVSMPIVQFPAIAVLDSIQKQTEALESYIKENNLDIDVNNLQAFFSDFRNKFGNIGGLSGAGIRMKAFLDYIENGYDTSLKLMEQTNNDNPLPLMKPNNNDTSTDTENELTDTENELTDTENELLEEMLNEYYDAAAEIAAEEAKRLGREFKG